MKRLGRGLSAILEDAEAGYLQDLQGIREIDIEKIKPNPFQPRKEFNEKSIKELANSIKEYGLLQPIVVIKDKNKFILVAGERRLRAVKSLNYKKIKAIVVDYNLDALREYALIENIQRENLNPIEIALSLYELIKKYNYTHEELAKKLGKSRAYISNILRILNLPEEVINSIKTGNLSLGHAKVLVNLSENDAINIANKVKQNKLSVRETERLVKNLKKEEIDVSEIVNKFKKLGLKVEKGNNYIKIKYKNETDLEKLRKLLEFIS